MEENTNEMRGPLALFLLALAILLWIGLHSAIYFSPRLFLPEDSFRTHWNLFSYLFNAIRFFRVVPDWVFSSHGGIWLAPLSNNYLTLLPYRILALAFAWPGMFSPELVYKFSFLILGVGMFLVGVFFASRAILRSTVWAVLVVAFAFFTAPHISLLHEEQALGTIFFVPWGLLALLRVKNDKRWILVFAALCGLSLNNHYPQLIVLYLFFGALSFLIFGPRLALSRTSFSPWLILGALACFLISSSPLWYALGEYRNDLSSSFRHQTGSIEASDYTDYLSLNAQQESSVWPGNFLLYFTPSYPAKHIAPLDRFVFYLGPLAWLFFLMALYFPTPWKSLQLSWIALLALAATGVHGPLPRLLFPWFPGIRLFRQWFHFMPLLNLHLLFFLLIGAKTAFEKRARAISPAMLAGLLCVWLLVSAQWAEKTWSAYLAFCPRSASATLPLDSKNGFLDAALFEETALYAPLHVDTKLSHPPFPSSPLWSKDTALERVLKSDLAIAPWHEGFSLLLLHKPAAADLLILPEINDGRWLVKENGRTIQPTSSRALAIPIAENAQIITIERARDLWIWLLFLMWMPLLCTLYWLRTRGARHA